MTVPRQVLPGTTYLVTRRCFQRQFLLRPSQTTNGIFLYVLAVAARRFDVRIHAVCVLSNHFHLVLTDPHAHLPAFEQYLDSLVARAINSTLNRWESFWAPSSYSAVALPSTEDILEKAAYTLANPVAAGLVRRAREWPGIWTAPELIGGAPIHVTRPAAFFRPDGAMPESVDLELSTPPGFATTVDFRDRLVNALTEHEARAALEHRTFIGAANTFALQPEARPATQEPHRKLNPRACGRDKWKRIEALSRLREFLSSYRTAWLAMRAGVAGVVFPTGTYWLRVTLGVRCAAPG
jgi:REP element-mobilizing transposase RayT